MHIYHLYLSLKFDILFTVIFLHSKYYCVIVKINLLDQAIILEEQQCVFSGFTRVT